MSNTEAKKKYLQVVQDSIEGWEPGKNRELNLAKHDARFHPNGYKEGDTCNLREILKRSDESDKLPSPLKTRMSKEEFEKVEKQLGGRGVRDRKVYFMQGDDDVGEDYEQEEGLELNDRIPKKQNKKLGEDYLSMQLPFEEASPEYWSPRKIQDRDKTWRDKFHSEMNARNAEANVHNERERELSEAFNGVPVKSYMSKMSDSDRQKVMTSLADIIDGSGGDVEFKVNPNFGGVNMEWRGTGSWDYDEDKWTVDDDNSDVMLGELNDIQNDDLKDTGLGFKVLWGTVKGYEPDASDAKRCDITGNAKLIVNDQKMFDAYCKKVLGK